MDAQEKCHDKGGYLATLTCPKEIERVEEMIRNEGMDNSCFFVGCRRGAEMSPNSYPRYGLFWDDLSLRDPSCIGKWFHDEPSFSVITSNGVEVREDFVAFEKGKDLNEFFFKDVTNNIIKYYPEYSGKLGYICEFDDEDDTQLRINNSITFLYSLEGLSADEIVEECNIYLNNKLNSSQSDSDYEKVFKVRPMSMEESDNSYDAVYYRFIPVFGTAFNCNPGLDLIKRINVSRGSGEPQPGFEAYAEWKRMSVSIDLDIQDREKAIQVYEKFYEQLAPLYENSFEIRDDTYWSSAGSFWNEDHTLSSGVQLVCLAEHDDSYDIFVIKWHNVE